MSTVARAFSPSPSRLVTGPLETGPLVTGSLDTVAARLSVTRRYVAGVILAWFAVAVSPSWLPTPDSALYLMLGRSLAQGHGYALDGQPHAYVPPGFPLFLATLERAGLGSMFWLNLAMGLIGVLSVWVSYHLVLQLAFRPVALLIAGLLGFNSLLHVMSTLQLSDMPFTLLALTGLYCLLRGLRGARWALEIGTLAILASCWVRVAGVALAVACAAGLLVQPRFTSRVRVFGNATGLVAGVVATLGIFYAQYQNSLRAEHSMPPASYMTGVHSLLSQPLGALLVHTATNAYASVEEIPRFLMGLKGNPIAALFVCLTPLLVGIVRRLTHREFLVALAVAGYSGGIVLNLPAGARYLLPVAPLLLLYYLEGLSLLLDWHARVRSWAPRVLMVIVAAFVAFNGVKGLYVLKKNENQIAADRAAMAKAAACLRSQVRSGERFLSCDSEWQLAYLSEVPYLQLDRCLLAGAMARDQYLRFLFDKGVRLVVATPEKNVPHYPDESLIRNAVRDRQMFQPILHDGRFQIYRFLAPPAVSTADSSSHSRQQLLQ